MLHLIPAPLHRCLFRMGHALRKRWWQFRQPHLTGISVIATDLEDRLLLVRLTYGAGSWSLPTGGLKRGEAPEAAARREFREETGCEVGALEFVAMQEVRLHGAHHAIHVFAAKVQGNPAPDHREIEDARFFPLHSLPEPLSRMTRRRLELWHEGPKG